MYKKALLERTVIESDTGFTIGLEVVVKAHLAGSKVAEVPTGYRERTTGKSNFRVMKWLPAYLKWYLRALTGRRAAAPAAPPA